MEGWKSKVGGILIAISTGLFACCDFIPDEEIGQWTKAVSIALGGIGTSLLGVGMAHKIEKAGVSRKE